MYEDTVRTIYENDTVKENQTLVQEVIDMAQVIPYYDKYITVSKAEFKLRHHVGIMQTENFRIQVLPKIWKSDLQGNEYASRNLIKLLLYAFAPPRFNVPEIDISGEKTDFDLLELVIRLYATSLEDQLSRGVYKRYTRRQEESMFIRGKLDIGKQISRIDKSKFDVNYFKFTSDNDLNRFFIYSTGVFKKLTRDIRNLEILSSIESMLTSEEITQTNPNIGITFNRLNERFQIPYTYAKIILDSLLIITGSGRRAMMMLFDMNVVFERFFAKFIERNKEVIFRQDIDIEVSLSQHSMRNFIYNLNNRPLRSTQPDLKVAFGGSTYIFDTKYKILKVPDVDEDEDMTVDDVTKISSGDLYQMFTYSELYRSSGTIMVFPGSENRISESYHFTKDGRPLWVYMLHLDLNNEKWEEKLVREFRDHFRKIVAEEDYIKNNRKGV